MQCPYIVDMAIVNNQYIESTCKRVLVFPTLSLYPFVPVCRGRGSCDHGINSVFWLASFLVVSVSVSGDLISAEVEDLVVFRRQMWK